jgi:hypothetical protein
VRATGKLYCHPAAHDGAAKLLIATPQGRCPPPYRIRVGGADLWYQIRLGDTTVEQSLAP